MSETVYCIDCKWAYYQQSSYVSYNDKYGLCHSCQMKAMWKTIDFLESENKELKSIIESQRVRIEIAEKALEKIVIHGNYGATVMANEALYKLREKT